MLARASAAANTQKWCAQVCRRRNWLLDGFIRVSLPKKIIELVHGIR